MSPLRGHVIGLGSGAIVSEDGKVLTAAHVIGGEHGNFDRNNKVLIGISNVETREVCNPSLPLHHYD